MRSLIVRSDSGNGGSWRTTSEGEIEEMVQIYMANKRYTRKPHSHTRGNGGKGGDGMTEADVRRVVEAM